MSVHEKYVMRLSIVERQELLREVFVGLVIPDVLEVAEAFYDLEQQNAIAKRLRHEEGNRNRLHRLDVDETDLLRSVLGNLSVDDVSAVLKDHYDWDDRQAIVAVLEEDF